MAQVRQYLALKGWLVFRHQQGLGSHKGFPDLTALKDGETIYIEVKTPRGRLSDYQKLVGEQITAAGARYLVVRSLDDIMEQIG